MTKGLEDRLYWINVLSRIAKPVLSALAEKRLKVDMPVEEKTQDRGHFTFLEALGRTLTGISPWLELQSISGDEQKLHTEFCELSRLAIDAATDPHSPDYMNFTHHFGSQPVVDASFLAQGIIRAPRELLSKLDERVKRNLVAALKSTRECAVCYNNWLLFAATIEAALYLMGEDWDRMRVDYAVKQLEQWYMGDGIYSDGPCFHYDYYNSFVIHPMLVDVLSVLSKENEAWEQMNENVVKRASRYASIQEKLISPEGTFPAVGRSLTYRFAAFHSLSQMALQHRLPEDIKPAQVRCALTAVIKRMIETPGTFDNKGWLKIGFCGSQPDIGEDYISTGSLYLCTTALLPLGLPPEDEFWSGTPEEWSSVKIWSGKNVAADYALE